jgi:hypothetical protein
MDEYGEWKTVQPCSIEGLTFRRISEPEVFSKTSAKDSRQKNFSRKLPLAIRKLPLQTRKSIKST